MSDIQQRIADILDGHRESFSQNTAWDECKYCSHNGDWAKHAAAVLVSELGLTRERGISLAGDPITATIYPDIYGPKWSRHARYVTTWEAEQ